MCDFVIFVNSSDGVTFYSTCPIRFVHRSHIQRMQRLYLQSAIWHLCYRLSASDQGFSLQSETQGGSTLITNNQHNDRKNNEWIQIILQDDTPDTSDCGSVYDH